MLGLSIFDSDGTMAAFDNLRLFSFEWNDVTFASWLGSHSASHRDFNNWFTLSFPKLMYTTPFTSYTRTQIGIGSQLMGLGESTASPSEIRAIIKGLAEAAGFRGLDSKLKVSVQTVNAIRQGSSINVPSSTVSPGLLASSNAAHALTATSLNDLRLRLPDSPTLEDVKRLMPDLSDVDARRVLRALVNPLWGLFPELDEYMPYVIGGGVLLLVLLLRR